VSIAQGRRGSLEFCDRDEVVIDATGGADGIDGGAASLGPPPGGELYDTGGKSC